MPTASTQIDERPIPMTSTTPLAGFAGLYERHYETVFRAALRVTGNPADAEDVLQTVFLRVLARGETSRTSRCRPPTSGAQPSTRPSTCCAAASFMRNRVTTKGRRRSPSNRPCFEGEASARGRRPGQRGRKPVPAASRRGAVDRRTGRDVPDREEQRGRQAPPDPAPAAGRNGTLGESAASAAVGRRTAMSEDLWKEHSRR